MIAIPNRMGEILKCNKDLEATIGRFLSRITPFIKENKLTFFPDFTDHGIAHVNEVLSACDSIITDEAWSMVSPEDVFVMICSSCLHDSAMHLTEDGFAWLLSDNYPGMESEFSHKEDTWIKLWETFFAEAKRFDQKKLIALYGDNEPVVNPIKKSVELTKRDRLLIGEFLRRFHTRLAHEIAIIGIPGVQNSIKISDDEHSRMYDLSGFVARSHGTSLRKAVEQIPPKLRREISNCHAPFVMSVLRIADYLQIQSSRAPSEVLKIKSLTSPISSSEWKKHIAINSINTRQDDPEVIYIEAKPDSAKNFTALSKLFADIQHELDQTWAMLGEMYGRIEDLNKLGLTIRRIRSNLDDPAQFKLENKPIYVPKEIKFKTASGELLDLLVSPLYGDKPGVGVRELVQNAVDACLERDDLVEKGIVQPGDKQETDVVVNLICTQGNWSIVIEDFGVGMTLDVIENYFLNIGASFRSSDQWRKIHEVEGKSNVNRTGRFGIGVLAAFLLGNKIQVTTRHINAGLSEGFTFACSQGDDELEVKPCSFHHGTRIEIEISQDIFESLTKNSSFRYVYDGFWDWYCLDKPRVQRLITNPNPLEQKQSISVPCSDSELTGTNWTRIDTDDFEDVMWSFDSLAKGYYDSGSSVICNGIYVPCNTSSVTPHISEPFTTIYASDPTLNIFDPNGRLPLNLQRDDFTTEELSFSKKLADSIAHVIAGRIVEGMPKDAQYMDESIVAYSMKPGIKGLLEVNYYASSKLIVSQKGLLPIDYGLMAKAQIESLLVDAAPLSSKKGMWNFPALEEISLNYMRLDVNTSKNSQTHFVRRSIEFIEQDSKILSALANPCVCGRRIFCRKTDVNKLLGKGNVPKSSWGRMEKDFEMGEWACWKIGNTKTFTADYAAIIAHLEENELFGFSLMYFDWSKFDSARWGDSHFHKSWITITNSTYLPYSNDPSKE